MADTVEIYGDEATWTAILKRNYANVGNEYISSAATAVKPYAFNATTTLTKVSIPNAVKIGAFAFAASTIGEVDLSWDKIEEIREKAFQGSTADAKSNPSKQRVLNLPKLSSLGDYAFSIQSSGGTESSPIEEAYLPILENIPLGAFRYRSHLAKVKLSAKTLTIGNYAFGGCSSLEALILDKVEAVPSYGTACLNGTLLASTGAVYVPDSIVDAFKADASWGNFNIKACEDYPAIVG